MADSTPSVNLEAINIKPPKSVSSQDRTALEPPTGPAQQYTGSQFVVPGNQPYTGPQAGVGIATLPYFNPQPFTSPPAYSASPACAVSTLPLSGQGYDAFPAYPQVVPARYPTRVYKDYPEKTSLGLGITQVLMGALCIIFQAVSIGFNSLSGYIGVGIWCGVMVGQRQLLNRGVARVQCCQND